MGERITLAFEDARWTVEEQEDFGNDDDDLEALIVGASITPPNDTSWWSAFDGVAYFELHPFDNREAPKLEGPVVWAGVSFDDPDRAPKTTPTWIASAEDENVAFFEDPDNAGLEYVGEVKALSELISDKRTASDQANTVADWIRASLEKLSALGAP